MLYLKKPEDDNSVRVNKDTLQRWERLLRDVQLMVLRDKYHPFLKGMSREERKHVLSNEVADIIWEIIHVGRHPF